MEILEFRKITTDDKYDQSYVGAWSRVYEYPLVIDMIHKYASANPYIHNTCWGFEGVHVKFKNQLETMFKTDNSDIKSSNLPNTFVYDLTNPPPSETIEKYDAVINVSVLEEIKWDHIELFNNLMTQVKPNGILILTFDLPGLQLAKFERMFGRNIVVNGTPINGFISKNPNNRYGHLNCGLLVIRK